MLIVVGIGLFFYSSALSISPLVMSRRAVPDFRMEHWLGMVVWVLVFAMLARAIRRLAPNGDGLLLSAAGLLSGVGLLTIWRLSTYFGLRQTTWLVVAGAIFLLGLRLAPDLLQLRRYKYLWLSVGLLLTSLTFLFGVNPMGVGPRLWLGCCGLYMQPSEPLKLLLIVFLAAYLADRQPLTTRTGLLLAPTALMMAVATLMLLAQRDLGTASIFILIYTAVIYLATGKMRALLAGGALLLAGAVAGTLLFDVVNLRIEAWLDPWLDPSGRSYQIVQSIMAVSAGGLLGRGPGMGVPYFVPVSHSDFIFTSLAEETGLLGAVGLITTMALVSIKGLQIARRAGSVYHRCLAAGLAIYFAGQGVLIMGGNVRLLPLTGVTLPFVSYGGSSLVTAFAALLLLVQLGRANPPGRRARFDPLPVEHLSTFVLAGFACLTLTVGWWALVRAPDLLTRSDNPRRAFADRYVPRGTLLDRSYNPLSLTSGETGGLERTYPYEFGGSMLGYNHPNYGQSGLEAGLDAILRGLERQPPLALWSDHLLYGQPPPGLDVRLSLDLELQRRAEHLLQRQRGALVMMDALSGEILAMVSAPSFDANRLDQDWDSLIQDADAPLLNRATQARYQPGTALNPFLYAAALARGPLPALPTELLHSVDQLQLDCTRSPQRSDDWVDLIANGCPGAAARLGLHLGSEPLLILFDGLGFYTTPDLPLPVAQASPKPPAIAIPEASAVGQSELTVSPLQLAIAASALSAQGKIPLPQIALSVHTASGWQVFRYPLSAVKILPRVYANLAANSLRSPALPIWETLGSAANGPDQTITWYLGGMLPGYEGTPVVVVVLLESDYPSLAQAAGQALLREMLVDAP